MTPYDFGITLADRLLEKQAEGEIHPLQSPAAGYREEQFRQKQVEQQQQQAEQQQLTQQQSANLPQGPTATNTPNIGPPQQLEPNDLQSAAQPAAKQAMTMASLNARICTLYQQLYSTKTATNSIAGQIARSHATEKDAGVVSGLMGAGKGMYNFGKGMYAATKPVTGMLTGGFGGARRGFSAANQLIRTGGKLNPAAVAGAGVAAYGMYNTLQNPIQQTGDGVRFRSPVRVPAMRFRTPVTSDGGMVVRNPVKVLW